MWVCSGKYIEWKPRASTSRASRTGLIDRSVRKTVTPSRTGSPSSVAVSGKWSAGTTCHSRVMDDDAADVPAGVHVGVGLVDLVQPVGRGDQLVQFEPPGPVHRGQPGDLVRRATHPEDHPLDPLLHHGQQRIQGVIFAMGSPPYEI